MFVDEPANNREYDENGNQVCKAPDGEKKSSLNHAYQHPCQGGLGGVGVCVNDERGTY